MASNFSLATVCLTLLAPLLLSPSASTAVLEQPPQLLLNYHGGALLKGTVSVNIIWYGKFSPGQRDIIVDFLDSLNSRNPPQPSVSTWWRTTEKYKSASGASTRIVVGRQIFDETYSLGTSLTNSLLVYLAARGGHKVATVNIVLTAKDVVVDGFCRSRCASHGSTLGAAKFVYAWVGNAEFQCPGYCAWPFHGPQTPPLVAPNDDVGVDGMLINLATVLAGAVTNPFDTGYFQGPPAAPLEAVTACTGVFGSGAYPGYAGRVLVDKGTGASYNAHGLNGREFLLPAMWDPQTSHCSTLV